MIRAPTGGSPNVIGSSIATVAMVPMPGSTPTSVPTSAPIRQSRRLIGVKATPKPRARLEKSSVITPSLDQETREELQRQPERIREKQTAADRQADADDDGFLPSRLRRAQRRDDEARKRRDHETQRPDRDGEGEDRQRYEQRTAPRIGRDMLAIGSEARPGLPRRPAPAAAPRTCAARFRHRTKIRACPADRSMPTGRTARSPSARRRRQSPADHEPISA